MQIPRKKHVKTHIRTSCAGEGPSSTECAGGEACIQEQLEFKSLLLDMLFLSVSVCYLVQMETMDHTATLKPATVWSFDSSELRQIGLSIILKAVQFQVTVCTC